MLQIEKIISGFKKSISEQQQILKILIFRDLLFLWKLGRLHSPHVSGRIVRESVND